MNLSCYEDTVSLLPNQTHRSIYSPNYVPLFYFEKEFDKQGNRRWMEQHWFKVFYIILAYLSMIYVGQKIMRNRQAFKLQGTLFLWNLSVAIFSIMGAYRTASELLYVLKDYGFIFSLCSSRYIEVTRVTGLWAWLFTLSKVAELIDTLFIVLRKRKLLFFHWYHHSTVLVVCFYGYKECDLSVPWLIVMNFLAHSLMYSYFALRSLGVKVPSYVAMFITGTEIFQMVLFCVLCAWAHLIISSGGQCHVSESILVYLFFLASSYFILFSHYFYKAYVVPKLKQAKKLKEKCI